MFPTLPDPPSRLAYRTARLPGLARALPDVALYTRALPSVAILDPALATRNAGDEIISEAARGEIARLLPHAFQATLPTHERLGPRSWRFCLQAQHRIVAGSNILTGRLPFDRQWRLRLRDLPWLRRLTLLGAGWRAYGTGRPPFGDAVLRGLFSGGGLHSVRDGHTRDQLRARGIAEVVNTGCVTMWGLDCAGLARLDRRPARRVVTTVNVGHRSPADVELLQLLTGLYSEVLLWPQGIDDLPYAAGLAATVPGVMLLGPTLAAYDAVLAAGDVDFVGNRLHGGIRALQHGRRALILTLDNRAAEIARDTNLPVASLCEGPAALARRLRRPDPIEIALPEAAIAAWRAQFPRPPANPAGTGAA